MKIQDKTTLFTIISVVVFLLSWLIYDIYAITKGGTEASISFMVYTWAYKYPIFTHLTGLFEGILIGHFFWRIRDTAGTKLISDNSRESVDSKE